MEKKKILRSERITNSAFEYAPTPFRYGLLLRIVLSACLSMPALYLAYAFSLLL